MNANKIEKEEDFPVLFFYFCILKLPNFLVVIESKRVR